MFFQRVIIFLYSIRIFSNHDKAFKLISEVRLADLADGVGGWIQVCACWTCLLISTIVVVEGVVLSHVWLQVAVVAIVAPVAVRVAGVCGSVLVLLLVLNCEAPGEGAPVGDVGVKLGQVDDGSRMIGKDLTWYGGYRAPEIERHRRTGLVRCWSDLQLNDSSQVGVVLNLEAQETLARELGELHGIYLIVFVSFHFIVFTTFMYKFV